MTAELEVRNLHVSIEDNKILKGVNLTINKGEIHALMGPNGSGKSTMSFVIMGHPAYKVDEGDIFFRGESILNLSPDKRARLGIFLSFQYPSAVPGVSVANFLLTAMNAKMAAQTPEGEKVKKMAPIAFKRMINEKMKLLKIDDSFLNRYLNDGFSGGEKKRVETLQLAMLTPTLAILDETDSGLDIDALRTVSEGINTLIGPDLGLLLITHYQRILDYVKPDFIHVMMDGRIVRDGGPELVSELEARGYDWIREEVANGAPR